MNVRKLVIPLLFAAAVLFAFFFTDLGQWPASLFNAPSDVPANLAETYEPLSLTYVDPVHGFSVRYPLGYPLQADDGQTVTFFAPGPSGLSESYVFQVVNESYSAKELESIGVEEFQVDPVSMQTVSVSGRPIIRLQYLIPPEHFGESLHIVQALVPCGTYSLYFVASIPDSLRDDVALADYSLYSAQCGPSSSDAA